MAGVELVVTGTDELKRVQNFLQRLPPAARPLILPNLGKRAVKFMQDYEPYKYVSRASAYPDAPAGAGWFSAKQRRFVMAMLRSGVMKPGTSQRTNTLKNGWTYQVEESSLKITNTVPYAQYVQGDGTQSRHEQSVGWMTVSAKLRKNQQQLMNTLRAAYRTALNRIARQVGLNGVQYD